MFLTTRSHPHSKLSGSKINRQVHIHKRQLKMLLIYTYQRMDCYQSVIDHIKVRSLRKQNEDFFQGVAESILLYKCTTLTSTQHMMKKLDKDYIGILCAILNKSWKRIPHKQQLYGHIWRIEDGLTSDVHLWNPTHERASKDLFTSALHSYRAINDRDKWGKRHREIHAASAT